MVLTHMYGHFMICIGNVLWKVGNMECATCGAHKVLSVKLVLEAAILDFIALLELKTLPSEHGIPHVKSVELRELLGSTVSNVQENLGEQKNKL